MYLKALCELDRNNSSYFNAILKENLLKILKQTDSFNEDDIIGNSIMGIVLNRLANDLFANIEFKKNASLISKVFDDGKLFELSLTRQDRNALEEKIEFELRNNRKTKSKDFEKNLKEVFPYLVMNKKNIISLVNLNKDILTDENASFNVNTLNKLIFKINKILINRDNKKEFDYLKNQYVYLSLLMMKKQGLTLDFNTELDNYLDALRVGYKDNRLKIFLSNARNSYYHCNPYGEFIASDELVNFVSNVEKLVVALQDTFEENNDKNFSSITALHTSVKKYVEALYSRRLSNKVRDEIFTNHSYLEQFNDFLKDFKEKRIDYKEIKRGRTLEIFRDNFAKLADEAIKEMDGESVWLNV